MAQNGKLLLTLSDVEGKPLKEVVDLDLEHHNLSDRKAIRKADASEPITIADLHSAPQGVYKLSIKAPSYRRVKQFININASGTTTLGLALVKPAKEPLPEITFRQTVVTKIDGEERKIDIEADEETHRNLARNRNSDQLSAYLASLVEQEVGFRQSNGLGFAGFNQLVLAERPIGGAETLMTRNDKIWNQIRLAPEEGNGFQKIWVCGPWEDCQCSTCRPVDVIIIVACW